MSLPGLDVHVICDNYATHKTPAIQKWLPAHPRFQMHFTPTSSSWRNQVERWFGLLTDRQIRRGVHKNVRALEKDIRDWIAHGNDGPSRSPGMLRAVLDNLLTAAVSHRSSSASPASSWLGRQ